jgi:hypothetical protein
LSDDSAAARAQRCAHGKLFSSTGGACKKEVCNIGAGNQQDQTNGAKENKERGRHITRNTLLQRQHIHAIGSRISRRVFAGELLRDRIHLSACLLDGYTRP